MTVLSRFRELYEQLADLNIDQLESVYHKDVKFQDPIATHQGIEKVKSYFSNLLSSAASCSFNIHNIVNCQGNEQSFDHVVTWTMTLRTSALNKGKPIVLDGTSVLRVADDKVIYHRDYYDVGQMMYEHIPLLGFFIRKIKQRLAQK